MFKVEKISYGYSDFLLFKNVSFSISKGIIGIKGPSGSGKTSFLKTIGGYLKPNSGTIYWDRENIRENIYNYRKKNGFHFQTFNLIDLSVKDNLQLPFLFTKIQKDEGWIQELINYFEISEILDKNIENISGGEKERVSIVKSLINKPKLIFLDEASASLDKRLKQKCFEFIKEYAKENIVFLINHDDSFKDFFDLKNTIYKDKFEILCS